MTTESEPDGGRPDPGVDAITSERCHLINLAYRLLGSLTRRRRRRPGDLHPLVRPVSNRTELRPIEGGEQVARFLADLVRAAPSNVKVLERTVNGQPGLVAQLDGATVCGVHVRDRGRQDHPHLGNAQPPQAPALDHGLTPTLLPGPWHITTMED